MRRPRAPTTPTNIILHTHCGMAQSTASAELPPTKRRKVIVNTVNKWRVENDKALNTSMWLTFEKLGREHVALLKCAVCGRFEEKLRGCRNYNSAFVVGTANLRVSAVKDHAATEMHKRSMMLLRKSRREMWRNTRRSRRL